MRAPQGEIHVISVLIISVQLVRISGEGLQFLGSFRPAMSSSLRIANASAFWGDQPEAAARLVEADRNLDYLTLDYLAEVSLSIMAIVRERDPDAGYARDFVEVIRSLVPFYRSGGKTRIVTNAGG